MTRTDQAEEESRPGRSEGFAAGAMDAAVLSVLDAVLADACGSPSWSNTQPYRVALATGELRDRLAAELCDLFDRGMAAQNGGLLGKTKLLGTRRGLPDGDFSTRFAYADDLQARRRDTGHGLYALMGIDRKDSAARDRQMRRNFEFFGAPVVIFLFAHRGLHEFSALDTGIYLQTLMLSAQAHGVATCAQGALATWAGPVRSAFEIPQPYRLICGVSIGYASDHAVDRARVEHPQGRHRTIAVGSLLRHALFVVRAGDESATLGWTLGNGRPRRYSKAAMSIRP